MEILELARGGALKTQIMYKANLSFTQLNNYLKFMSKTNLLDKIVKEGKEIYRATEKGLYFLQRYYEINEPLARAQAVIFTHTDVEDERRLYIILQQLDYSQGFGIYRSAQAFRKRRNSGYRTHGFV